MIKGNPALVGSVASFLASYFSSYIDNVLRSGYLAEKRSQKRCSVGYESGGSIMRIMLAKLRVLESTKTARENDIF